MLTADDVREALRVCFDPELAVNIVDLGLLEAISLSTDSDAPGAEPRFAVAVDLLRRGTEEQREAMLGAQVANRLAGIYAVSRVDVRFHDAPVWTADRMSEAARRQLDLDRGKKAGLIQIEL